MDSVLLCFETYRKILFIFKNFKHEEELKRRKMSKDFDETSEIAFDRKFIDFCRWLDKIETNLALSIEDLSQKEQLESYEVDFSKIFAFQLVFFSVRNFFVVVFAEICIKHGNRQLTYFYSIYNQLKTVTRSIDNLQMA